MKLHNRVEKLRREVDNRKFFNQRCDENVAALGEELKVVENRLDTVDRANKFVNEVAMSRRNKIKGSFERIVSDALKLLYRQDCYVELVYDFKYRRNVLNIQVGFRHDGGYEVKREVDGFGGGVSDTVSTAFRILIVTLVDSVENVIWLDESYKHADNEMVERVGEFIRAVSKKMGIQIIFNSHHLALGNYADRVLHIEIDKTGASNVRVAV